MTNNPTIDGVSRELIERAISATRLARGPGSPTERDLRALLDAPAVERQEPEFPAGAIHNGRAFIDQLESIYAFKEQQGHPLSLCSEWQELLRCFEWLASHATEAQSTIARLEARVAELENGRGEPVAWNVHWSDNNEFYFTSRIKERADKLAADPEYKIIPLFTGPPAPVAAKYQERVEFEKWIVGEWPTAPLRYVRDSLPEDDPLHGTYCDEYLQRAWVGWQARACLDATAALNGVKP